MIEEDSRSIQRAADLSGVASAVLSLDYKRDNEFKEDGVALEISADPTG